MKNLTITFGISDNCIKNITFDINETDMPDDSETLEKLAYTLINILNKNRDSLKVQDVLNDLNIPREK